MNHCLANLNRAGTTNKRVHFATLQDGEKGKKMRSKAAVKYAATKLHEKVLVCFSPPPLSLPFSCSTRIDTVLYTSSSFLCPAVAVPVLVCRECC